MSDPTVCRYCGGAEASVTMTMERDDADTRRRVRLCGRCAEHVLGYVNWRRGAMQ